MPGTRPTVATLATQVATLAASVEALTALVSAQAAAPVRGTAKAAEAAQSTAPERTSTCSCGREFGRSRRVDEIPAAGSLCALKGADMTRHEAALKA